MLPFARGDQAWFSTATSLTLLYDRMVQPQRRVHNLYAVQQIKHPGLEERPDAAGRAYTWGDLALRMLGFLAYQGMLVNTIILSHHDLERALEEVIALAAPMCPEHRRGDHEDRLFNPALQLGFLRTIGEEGPEGRYAPLHLSFQAYLAGCWIAHVWSTDTHSRGGDGPEKRAL